MSLIPLCLLLLGLAPARAPVGVPVRVPVCVPVRVDVRDIADILREGEREPPPTAASLGARLASLGPGAIPDLFSVLAHGLSPEESPTPLATEALLQGLASFKAPALRPFLATRLGDGAPLEERAALLRVLGRVGTSPDIALARRALEGVDPGSLPSAELSEAIEGILRRDPRGVEAVRRWILECPDELSGTLVRAAGASGCIAALPMLVELLGHQPLLDPVLLPEIGRLAELASKPLEDWMLSALAGALEGEDHQMLREAALALGRAEDFESLPRLIVLLDHEARGVREAARWSLEKSTGLRFRGDSARWSAWLREESSWYEEELPQLAPRLASPEPGIAVSALGEISQHRYQRHHLAREVETALENESSVVRRLACLTLARLGSSAALPALRQALEDEPGVAEAAHQALERLGAAPATPPETDTEP